MREEEMLWKVKEELESIAKSKSASCDLLWSGFDVYRFGFKCSKGAVGLQIKDHEKGCYAYILNADEKLLNELRSKDAWVVAEYDAFRKAEGKPFDIQLPVTCRKEEFERVLNYLINLNKEVGNGERTM